VDRAPSPLGSSAGPEFSSLEYGARATLYDSVGESGLELPTNTLAPIPRTATSANVLIEPVYRHLSQFWAGGYLDIKVTNLAPRLILRVRLRTDHESTDG
jgi:hypothetical protein